MRAKLGEGLSPARLRAYLALLFIALGVPTAVLLEQTQHQLKWEAFHQYRTLADELGLRIDAQLQTMIAAEEARGYSDYGFVILAGDPTTSNFIQRSALARYPVQSTLPGLVGYFQIGADGEFSTPLLPIDLNDSARWGLDASELSQRIALRDSLRDVLNRNRLLERNPVAAPPRTRVADSTDNSGASVSSSSSTPPNDKVAAQTQPLPSQAAFDELNAPAQQAARVPAHPLGRIDDLRLAQNFQGAEPTAQASAPAYEQRLKSKAQVRSKRTEQSAVVEPLAQNSKFDNTIDARHVRIFQSEVDPFEFSLLGDGHGVLYRKVWRNGQRTIQGAIIDQRILVDDAIVKPFEETALAQMSDLAVAYRHDVVRLAPSAVQVGNLNRAEELQGELLLQVRLSPPLGDFQLLWNINRLPAGPGGRLMVWAGAILFVVLILGCVLLYRLGMKQILLARQQQDFVSAVSHELNTPLTSIRMYAEMLDAGWADEGKKREYYRFIHDESERLSRLIANVLQLARMERNELPLDLKRIRVAVLMDMLRSKLSQQIERAGFECRYELSEQCAQRELRVDADAFVQIVINLVDNALKFAARSARHVIDIGVHAQDEQRIAIRVRDYGPGVEKSQMRRIFQLFYRSGSELTRETPGTGIGLALVRHLARAMGGDVQLHNRDPGAEFRLLLPFVR
jgi:signal transduction histidine kinase